MRRKWVMVGGEWRANATCADRLGSRRGVEEGTVLHAPSDGAALLRAIIDNPDEDTPRLVYADWLDEQGGESNAARAEFIRIQIAEYAKARQKTLTSVGALRFATRRELEL